MKRINNKGFTLVEILAVVGILGMILAILIPNVNTLIKEHEKNSEDKFYQSIITAAKIYISDYKYEISLESSTCDPTTNTINIDKIKDNDLNPNSQIKISTLIDEGNITTDEDGNIYHPKDKEKKLKLNTSYIVIKYNCDTKDYIYEVIQESSGIKNYTNLHLEYE